MREEQTLKTCLAQRSGGRCWREGPGQQIGSPLPLHHHLDKQADGRCQRGQRAICAARPPHLSLTGDFMKASAGGSAAPRPAWTSEDQAALCVLCLEAARRPPGQAQAAGRWVGCVHNRTLVFWEDPSTRRGDSD